MILGGAQENTLLTCEGLHARGHDVTLITGPTYGPEGQLIERARNGSYEVIELGSLVRPIHPWKDIVCYRQLKQLFRDLEADVVHTHSAKAGILGRWAAGAVRAEAADACCAPLRKLRQVQQQSCGRPRIVHTIHGLAFHPYLPAIKNRLYIKAERSAAKVTDAFISVADAMTEQALAAGIGNRDQFTTIRSGLEMEPFTQKPSPEHIGQMRRELNIDNEATVIVSVARLAELKGHEYIIKAAEEIAKKHQNVIWLFVGDGYWRKRIEKQINQVGLQDRFRFAGLVSPQRVAELLHASDILTHCSLREGLARVLPQAMLCGKAVISFDVDGAREVVANGETGFLLPPKEIEPLVQAQESLINDVELRHRLGQAGRQRCQQMFDHNLMVDQIEKLYRNIAG